MKKILSCEPYSINYLGHKFSLVRCEIEGGGEINVMDVDNLIPAVCLCQMVHDGILVRAGRSILRFPNGREFKRIFYDVFPPAEVEEYIKPTRQWKRYPLKGVPEIIFMQGVDYSIRRCGWASVGHIKRFLIEQGFAVSRSGVANRLRSLRRRGEEIP